MIEDLNESWNYIRGHKNIYLESVHCVGTDNRHYTILSCKYLFFDFVDISGC